MTSEGTGQDHYKLGTTGGDRTPVDHDVGNTYLNLNSLDPGLADNETFEPRDRGRRDQIKTQPVVASVEQAPCFLLGIGLARVKLNSHQAPRSIFPSFSLHRSNSYPGFLRAHAVLEVENDITQSKTRHQILGVRMSDEKSKMPLLTTSSSLNSLGHVFICKDLAKNEIREFEGTAKEPRDWLQMIQKPSPIHLSKPHQSSNAWAQG